MKIKKVFSSLMAVGLATTLAACGGENGEDNNTDQADKKSDVKSTDESKTETSQDEDSSSEGDTKDSSNEGEEGLSDEDKAELDEFENVTGDDTLVIGTSEMSGDFFKGWSNNSYDVIVRRLIGTEGTNAYATSVVDESGQWVNNETVLAEEPKEVENEDGSKTITYKLNEDLKWSDGEAVTADDYLFYSLLFSDPSYTPVTGATTVGKDSLKGYEAFHDSSNDVDEFEGLEKIDDYTFSVTVDSSFLPYYEEAYLSQQMPFPMHAVTDNLAISEDGKKLVAKEGYEVTEEDKKAYKDSIQEQIDNQNKQFEEDNEGAEVDEETQKAHDDEIAKLEERLNADVDPTQQLKEQAMLKVVNEYRMNPSVVCGPYVFDSYSNNMAKLSLNENYKGNFKGEKASIPHVIVQTVNQNIAVDLLENGNIDIWQDETDGGKIEQMRNAADEGKIKYNTFDRNGYGNVTFLTDRGSTQYKEVRQAIAHLMDRNSFVQQFAGGYGVVTNAMYGTSQWMYKERGADLENNPDLVNYQLNLDQANELLDQSPYKFESDGKTAWDKAKADEAFSSDPDGFDYYRYDENGERLVVNQYGSDESPITTLISNQVPNNAKQVGIEYNVTAGSFATLLDYYYNPAENAEYTAFNMGQSFEPPFDPYYQFNSKGFDNHTKTNDAKGDEVTEALRKTDPEDKEGYLDKWEDFQLWYNDYLPEIPLYSNQYHTGYTNRVQGFDINTPEWSAAYQINAMSLSE